MRGKSALMAEHEAFRLYVADILKASAEGKTLNLTLRELMERRTRLDFDAGKVADMVIEKAGLVVKDEPA